MSKPAFIIHSSHGDMDVDDKGVPFGVVPTCFLDIRRFDVDEYKKWGEKHFPKELKSSPVEVDILEIGYWYGPVAKQKFCPPEAEFREHVEEVCRQKAAS